MPSDIEAPPGTLALWVIYDRPADYPAGFVLRPQFACRNGHVTFCVAAWYSPDINTLRALLPMSVDFRLDRFESDAPEIVEVWI